MANHLRSAMLLAAVVLTAACDSNSNTTIADAPSAAPASSATTAASTKPTKSERVSLPVIADVPYRLSNIRPVRSLGLLRVVDDFEFNSDNDPADNYIEFRFQLTVTADTSGHRLEIHHICRFGDVLVSRNVSHEGVSTDTEGTLLFDAMKAGQSGTANSYIWPVPAALGVATACEATFVDTTPDAAHNTVTTLGSVCATSDGGIVARGCNLQEFPDRTAGLFEPPKKDGDKETFATPKVEWKKDGVMGWYTLTKRLRSPSDGFAWQRLRCGHEDDMRGLFTKAQWLGKSCDIRELRHSESSVAVFASFGYRMDKDNALCELALGVGPESINLMRAEGQAVWCIRRSGTKKGPCPRPPLDGLGKPNK